MQSGREPGDLSGILTRCYCQPENQFRHNMRCFSKAASLSIVVAAFLALLLSAAPALASMKLSVGNPGLQHFESDGVVELDFGLTGPSGQPVGNLSPDNVKVYENGKPAQIVDFRGVGQGRPVDIVFVMDVTDSMQPYIDAVKQSMISFARDLAAHNRDYRLGLVTFEDYVVSSFPDCQCAYRNHMTSNVDEFIKWVGSLHAAGGGDIPEDQLGALAYASKLPFRPNAEGILILITDAPPHHRGDGSAYTQHDAAFWAHHKKGTPVTNLTASDVAGMLKKQGLTLYAVVPPPFIAPRYEKIVKATHGKSYNIITEQGRFASLVREIGHSIATEYSLSYKSPRPIEDGTTRNIELKVSYGGDTATADTSYQLRGIGGATVNVSGGGAEGGANGGGTGLSQLSFSWWNAVVPLLAILSLFGLSRMRFGLSTDELKAALAAQAQRDRAASGTFRAPTRTQRAASSAPARTGPGPAAAAPLPPGTGATLSAIDAVAPVASSYSIMKDEVSLGRGEDNDIVIPHASISRTHARLIKRDGAYELRDLNSTNGTFVDDLQVHGSMMVSSGTRVRFGEVQFVLRY